MRTRLARRDDLPALVRLGVEMGHFYGGEDVITAELAQRRLESALFGERPIAEAVLALRGGDAVGFALFAPIFGSRGLTISLYIKEAYVTAAARRLGAGTALFGTVARLAVERGCSRLEWTTEPSNVAARAFYERIGAPPHDKVFYRAADQSLARLAGLCPPRGIGGES